MNAIGYCRVSTDGQVGDDKFGIESQKEQIVTYAKKNDINIVEWFIDEGVSGVVESRPQFDKIIYGEVANPPYEAVLVAKNDRIARDINIYFYYKMMLKKKNIVLISIAEDFGQFGAFSSILEAFTLCVAQMERENINKRTSMGRDVKASRGGYAGGRTPFGYIPQNRKLVIKDEEAEIVKTIFELKDNQNKTYQYICDYLNSQGKVNRSGKPFLISTVQTIYENRNVYLGYYKYGKAASWVKGEHDAIISEDYER